MKRYLNLFYNAVLCILAMCMLVSVLMYALYETPIKYLVCYLVLAIVWFYFYLALED